MSIIRFDFDDVLAAAKALERAGDTLLLQGRRVGTDAHRLDVIIESYRLTRRSRRFGGARVVDALGATASRSQQMGLEVLQSASRLHRHAMLLEGIDDALTGIDDGLLFLLEKRIGKVIPVIGPILSIKDMWNGIGLLRDPAADLLEKVGGGLQVAAGYAGLGVGIATVITAASGGTLAPLAAVILVAAGAVSVVGWALENHERVAGGAHHLREATKGLRESVAETAESLWNGMENAWTAVTGFFGDRVRPAIDEVFSTAEQIRSLLVGIGAGVASTGAVNLPDPQFQKMVPIDFSPFNPRTWDDAFDWVLSGGRLNTAAPEIKRFDYPLFGDRIDYRSITQGALGDCWLVAAAMALARDHPDMLRRMIRDNGDGTYTVTFADGRSETVDGDLYVDNEGDPIYAKVPREQGLWFAILEKAYAQREHNDFGHLHGGRSFEAFEALVGLGSITSVRADPNETWALLTRNYHENQAMVVGTAPASVRLADGTNLVGKHAYLIDGLYTQDGIQYVALRNPHGGNDAALRVSIEDFTKHCLYVHTLEQ